MEIIFLDNGLTSKGEHSYSLVKKVGEALSARGLRHRVFGMASMDAAIVAEIGAIPHFRRSLYESESPTPNERRFLSLAAMARGAAFDRSLPSERTSSKVLNASFQRDLHALPADVWNAGNLIVAPGISQNQILALIRYLIAKPGNQRPRAVCQLMFAPNWTPWGRNAKLGTGLYGQAFRLSAPLRKTLFFTAENEAIAEIYRALYKLEIAILPVPFGAEAPAAAINAGQVPRLGFFGYSKCDKGFHLLPRAIDLCRRNGLEVDFTIQVQHGGWELGAIAAERDLRRIKGVRLIEGVLSDEDYIRETNRIDAMLLPYDPTLFGLRGSGIFTQSVAAGRPVVASLGTFAGKSIAAGEAEGEVFSPYDASSLAAAIARLVPRLADIQANAAGLAKAFALKHSVDAYVDVLMAHALR
jgi:glycosyltransferase involved in cell wall biosynthesis